MLRPEVITLRKEAIKNNYKGVRNEDDAQQYLEVEVVEIDGVAALHVSWQNLIKIDQLTREEIQALHAVGIHAQNKRGSYHCLALATKDKRSHWWLRPYKDKKAEGWAVSQDADGNRGWRMRAKWALPPFYSLPATEETRIRDSLIWLMAKEAFGGDLPTWMDPEHKDLQDGILEVYQGAIRL